MTLDLAVIIVNYNVSALLKKCLETVYASEGAFSYDVAVVDNNSQDDSVAMVAEQFPQATLIANQDNPGYPVANNQGMKALGLETDSPPRYTLLLNPDTELPTDALAKVVAYMDENPAVGVLGPKLMLPNGQLDKACKRSFPSPKISLYRMMGLSSLFPQSKTFGRYNMSFIGIDEVAEVDSVVGAFMLVRTAAIKQVGMLDERFWMYGEDLDWAKRIKDAGWKVMYYPKVEVLHVKRASSKQNPKAQFEFYRAMPIFYYKHYRDQTPALMHYLIMGGIALKGGRKMWPVLRAGRAILD